MKRIKEVLVSIVVWTFGLLVAVPLLLLITVLALVLPQRWYNDPGRALLRFIVWLFGGRVTVTGLGHINKRRTYLFMPNHVSLFDVPLTGGYIPNFTRGIQASEQFRWPVIGWFLASIGMIPIERSSAHASWSTLERAVQEIRDGKSILIMPESTRTRTGALQPFKKLPFRLAQVAGVDVVPIGLSGMYRFKSRVSWIIHPGPVKIAFGKPIPYEKIKKLSVEELMTLVRERISALIEYP